MKIAPLAEALAKAKAAWPTLEVPDDAFVAALRSRIGDVGAIEMDAELGKMHVADLFFATACALGEPRALAAFDERFVPTIRAALMRERFDASAIDEALQVVRETMLVSVAGGPARITEYAGRGPLDRWLRVVATRIAIRSAKDARRHQPLEASLEEGAVADAELDYLKRTYGAAFSEAFREAIGALAVSDRLLLKQRHAMGMTVTELGKLYGVNASTITRRVADARHRLEHDTRKRMMARLELRDADIDSVLRLIHSQMDISISTTSDWDKK